MNICKNCGKQFPYNSEVGYAVDLCGPYCDGAYHQKQQIERTAGQWFHCGIDWADGKTVLYPLPQPHAMTMTPNNQRTIHKFPLNFGVTTELQIPRKAKLLHAGYDNHGVLCVWALLDPEMERVTRHFNVAATGQLLSKDADQWTYIGSAVGDLVWHVFEITA